MWFFIRQLTKSTPYPLLVTVFVVVVAASAVIAHFTISPQFKCYELGMNFMQIVCTTSVAYWILCTFMWICIKMCVCVCVLATVCHVHATGIMVFGVNAPVWFSFSFFLFSFSHSYTHSFSLSLYSSRLLPTEHLLCWQMLFQIILYAKCIWVYPSMQTNEYDTFLIGEQKKIETCWNNSMDHAFWNESHYDN